MNEINNIEDKFIRDKGKIRNCDSNIAKMSIYEYIKFQLIQEKFLGYAIKVTCSDFLETLKELSVGIMNIVFLIFFPITLTVQGYLKIKRAKLTVKKYTEKRSN